MRIVYLVALILLALAMAIFAIENRETMTLRFFDQGVTCPRSLMIAIVYLLGMVSGWTVLGLLRRSLRGATERREG